MTVTIGEIQAVFDAKTAQFRAAVDGLDRRIARFENDTERRARNVSGSFLRARAGVGALGIGLSATATKVSALYAAIAGAGAAAAGVLLLSKSIADASQQEDAIQKLNTALRTLGTDGAAKASAAIRELADETQRTTKFADEDTVGAAARIAAFVKQTTSIRGLVAAAQDFAAATGADLSSAAALLGKSVGSTTNALARYGITIKGAAGSTERAQSAIAGITRVFGGQAAAAAQTFSGAMAQVNNAFSEVLESVGDLVIKNPAAIQVLNQLRDGFFALAERINQNRDALARGLLQAFASAIGVFASFARTLADVSRFFDDLGVTVRNVTLVLRIATESFGIFFEGVRVGFIAVKAAVLGFLAELEGIPTAVSDIAEEFKVFARFQSTEKLQRDLARLNEQLAVAQGRASKFRLATGREGIEESAVVRSIEGSIARVRAELQTRSAGLEIPISASRTRAAADRAGAELVAAAEDASREINDRVFKLGQLGEQLLSPDTAGNDRITGFLAAIGERAGLAQAQVQALVDSFKGLRGDVAGGGGAAAQEPLLDEQALEAGGKLLEKIQQQRIDAAARLKGPLIEQALAIQRQVDELRKATLTDEQRKAANAEIQLLLEQQVGLLDRQRNALGTLPDVLDQVQTLIRQLAAIDPTAAAEFEQELGRRVGSAIGPEAQATAAAELAKEIGDRIKEETAGTLGTSVQEATSQGLRAALTDGDVLGAFASSLQNASLDALSKAFSEATGGLATLLNKAFSGSLQGLGGALTGIIGGVVGAALNRTQVSSSAANIRSSIDNAQQVRGIVAGPSSIGIAEVGRGIQEAFTEPTRLLQIIAVNTGQIARGRSAAPPDPTGFTVTPSSLAAEGPSLV